MAHARTRKAILDEQIEDAYLDLYGYDPSVQKLFFDAMAKLRAIDSDVQNSFLLDTQEIIGSTTRPYFSAKLGNPLRRSCRIHRNDLERRMRAVVKDLRANLVAIVSATDEAIVRRSISRATLDTPTSGAVGSDQQSNVASLARWALLVGIDYCPRMRHGRLLGPSNDVALLSSLLQDRFRFRADHVIPLVGADATRKGIIDALDSIAAETQAGDLVLFYFSGNGSQVVPDQERPDHMVPTLVPYDSGREEGQNFDIGETELNRYLNRIAKNRRLVVVLDTCHSGGMGESQDAVPALHTAHDSIPIFPARGLGPPIPAEEASGNRVGTQLSLVGRYTLLTACRKSEMAYEVASPSGSRHGAFSYYLATVLANASPTSSYHQVLEEIAAQVNSILPNQNPQIRGEGNRTLAELFCP